jgi:hypothetical protein
MTGRWSRDKSVGASLVLTFLFGPFGLLYTNPIGALVLLVVALVLAVVTLGVGLIIIWPVSMVWGAVSASEQHATYQRWLMAQRPPAPPQWPPPAPRLPPPPPPPSVQRL